MSDAGTVILGAGMTGLAAGIASGAPVFEARDVPGGICSSYYVSARTGVRANRPVDEASYRFEVGGGHWIFGGDPLVLRFVSSLTPLRSYQRKSSVYLPDRGQLVPYPIQNNLRYLRPAESHAALREMIEQARPLRRPPVTLADWLMDSFGPKLNELFFAPFHELYTAGLWRSVAPQDPYKSPVRLDDVVAGAFRSAKPAGYNTTFVYPTKGLDELSRKLAEQTDVHFGHRVVAIDAEQRRISFSNGFEVDYQRVLSTLPLNRMLSLTDLPYLQETQDPATSVLVVNIGGVRGAEAPDDHWVYVPRSQSGFHRVGFYSNVDTSFLPDDLEGPERISIYVELGRPEGLGGLSEDADALAADVVDELLEWNWLETAEVVDPTWVEVGYTWARPGSMWKQGALRTLADKDIFQIGRYGRWQFQGIADSLRDGFMAGAAVPQ